MKALKRELMATPVRTIAVLEEWDVDDGEMAMTNKVVRNAPRKEAIGKRYLLPPKKHSTTITIKPAPELTPIIFGEQRSLSVIICKINPLTLKAIPDNSAPRTLGSLNLKTMVLTNPLVNNSLMDKEALPKHNPMIRIAINNNANRYRPFLLFIDRGYLLRSCKP